MKLGRLAWVAVVIAGAAGMSAGARAQVESREGIALQNQILQLQQQVQALSNAQPGGQGAGGPSPNAALPPPVPQGAPPPADAGDGNDTVASLLVRVNALEEQLRQLSGRVDDLTNQLQHQNDDLSKQIGDLAFKMGQGAQPGATDQQAGTAPPQTAPVAVPKPPPPAPVKRPPEIALRAGNAALARRDYAAAAAAAREVLAAGQGPRATDAQLLLARAESGQKQHKQAAADFYAAYTKAPKAASAPVALLGVANALIALNDPKDACQALAKLHAEFPAPASSVKQGLASARKRAACP